MSVLGSGEGQGQFLHELGLNVGFYWKLSKYLQHSLLTMGILNAREYVNKKKFSTL